VFAWKIQQNHHAIQARATTDATRPSSRRKPGSSAFDAAKSLDDSLRSPLLGRPSDVLRACPAFTAMTSKKTAIPKAQTAPQSQIALVPSTKITSAIQLRLRRANRSSHASPSSVTDDRRSIDGSTPSNVLTFTTAYSRSSIRLLTSGTTPHRVQIRNCAVSVSNA